jgi:hypothetical protein
VELVNASMKSGMTCVRGSKNTKADSVQAGLCNEEGVVREDWDSNDFG